ncbi:MAG: hypothetical protein KGZ25_12010 [Planctomycetes bacterium]|nr:hypothetical protein [Planctomycetota bacterium]
MKKLHERAASVTRPPGAPAHADVCLSSRWHHPSNQDDPHDTFRAASAFHATRLDWVYFSPKDPVILRGAHSRNYTLGGAVSSKVPEAPTAAVAEPLGARRLDDEPVVAPWKRTWTGSNRIWGCVNNPEYVKAHHNFAKQMVEAGADRLHRDEPRGNLMCVPWGGCFCEHCVRKFRRYLADNISTSEREELGIDDLESYDCADHFRQLGAPAGDDFADWEGGRLKELFIDFQRQSTIKFHRGLREAVNESADALIPWSCNNCGGNYEWDELHSIFDFAIGEVYDVRNGGAWIWNTACAARENDKAQVFTVAEPDLELNRRVIATSYACGAHTIVPWDVYTGSESPRLYGRPEDYADLYGFVRANAPLLNGYVEAAAAGLDLPEDEAVLRIEPRNRPVWAFARVVPGWAEAPIGIHVVDWSEDYEPVRVTIRKGILPEGKAPTSASLRLPAPYEKQAHQLAEQAGQFQELVSETELDVEENSGEVMLTIPSLDSWAIAVLGWDF